MNRKHLKGPPRESEEDSGDRKACAMTILLLILLVVYVAVVSAPISMRLAGLILARNGLRDLPLPPGSTAARSGAPKSGISAAPKWLRRDCQANVRNQDVHVQGGKS